MAAFFDRVERLERQYAADAARVELFRGQIADKLAELEQAEEYEDKVARADELGVLERNLPLAIGVAERSAGLLEQAKAQRVVEGRIARHAELNRKAEADKKREKRIDATARELAELLKAKAADDAELDRFNREERGDLPFIIDAETRLRQKMGQPTPPVISRANVWVDAAGNVVKGEIANREGRWIKNPAAVRQEQRETILRPGEPTRPLPFKRLADEIRLINLSGEQIWPPR